MPGFHSIIFYLQTASGWPSHVAPEQGLFNRHTACSFPLGHGAGRTEIAHDKKSIHIAHKRHIVTYIRSHVSLETSAV